jgi:hypothetical protein
MDHQLEHGRDRWKLEQQLPAQRRRSTMRRRDHAATARRFTIMKAFLASVLLVVSVIALSSAVSADSPDRPPGVAAADWVPISDSLGIILLHDDRKTLDLDPFGAGPGKGAANGYFMVKDHGVWRRLVVVQPFAGRFEPTGT